MKHLTTATFSALFATLLYPTLSWAQVESAVDGASTLEGVVASEQPSYKRERPSHLKVEMNLSCYGVNLRNPAGTVNLLSTAPIPLSVTIKDHNNLVQTVSMQIPGRAFLKGSQQSTYVNLIRSRLPVGDPLRAQAEQPSYEVTYNIAPGGVSGTAMVADNSLVSRWPVGVDNAVVDAAGNVSIEALALSVQGVSFGDGIRMDKLTSNLSSDGRTLRINASVPSSAIGVCGSFVSPLMVFFDTDRPKFSAKANFELGQPLGLNVYWPEKKSKGYFLAFDKRGDQNIADGSQLFGSYDTPNGFDALKALDGNKDGVIDAKDKDFARLVLWQDLNADGKSDAKDKIHSLADKGIKSINLDYKANEIVKYGSRAESRERSSFVWTDTKGKEQTGAIEDIWFNTASSDMRIVKK